MPANRTETGQFVKGQSGNPSGRPKNDPRVMEILRAHSEEAALRIVELSRCKTKSIALAAAQEILNRTHGKPEGMSKIELTQNEDVRVIFTWSDDNADDNASV